MDSTARDHTNSGARAVPVSTGITSSMSNATISGTVESRVLNKFSPNDQMEATVGATDERVPSESDAMACRFPLHEEASIPSTTENSSVGGTTWTNDKSNEADVINELRSYDETNQVNNPHLKTLNQIRKVLKNYEPDDDLDQDSIESTILHMNKSSYTRRTRKEFFDVPVKKGWEEDARNDEMCWNDDDLFHQFENGDGPNYLHALVNVVEADFFYDIIDRVEADTTDFLLNEDTIKLIRESLAIIDDGKKRKRRDLKLAKLPTSIGGSRSCIVQSGINDPGTHDLSSTLSGEGREEINEMRPRTRGRARDTRSKYIEEHKPVEHEGLEMLLAAMIVLERDAGRPINLLEFQSSTKKLRHTGRVKSQKKSVESIEDDRNMKLFDAKGREVTKITVGGKLFASPKRRGPKRKRILNNEDDSIREKKVKAVESSFSLSVRDSKRKSPLKKKIQKNMRSLPTTVARKAMLWQKKQDYVYTQDNVDAIITSWEALDKFKEASEHPMTLEPPRKSHADKVYGKWCTTLAHCLQGSGRVFACHEFFYSDIDRAWFNVNPFHKDLEENDIDVDSQFTRKEWNAIRRKVRNRPIRRFSRAFIDEEFDALNNYRKEVRDIQKLTLMGIQPTNMKFEFEVLAPSQVGTTVTAYHHKAHLLHRGTVLCHDYENEAYLIQFEKKSLGYEWCADFEVASHGLQEVIFPSGEDLPTQNESMQNNTPHGCLPSGTDYASLIEFYNQDDHQSFASNDESTGKVSTHSFRNDVKEVVAKVEEREALVKLMCEIELILERKEALLDTIVELREAYNLSVGQPDFVQIKDKKKCSQFQNHGNWLRSNLKLNNRALESSLIQLQTIYGGGYTGFGNMQPRAKAEDYFHQAECIGKTVDSKNGTRHRHYHDMEMLAFDIGNRIASITVSPRPDSESVFVSTYNLSDYNSGMVSSAGGLLVTADLLKEMLPSKKFKTAAVLPILAMKASLNELKPEPFHHAPDEIKDVLKCRDHAYSSLVDAVNMFLAELRLVGKRSS